ncbi:MAG: hypothetical protein SGJ19_21010 [Planctomycetia bacterium]|nr:hypothetical protein [Planctomycetia bacterium]
MSESVPAGPPPIPDPQSAEGDAWQRYLLYTLSIPERTLRSGAGIVGGAVRESAALLIPRAFQNSQTYRILVQQTLDFLVQDIAGVAGKPQENSTPQVDNFIARKAVGNFIELAGMATVHLSPLTTLAIVADVAYGSSHFLKELSVELKRQHLIDDNAMINNVDDLLSAVADTAKVTSGAFDTPPLSVEGLKETVKQARDAATRVDIMQALPRAEVERLWNDMHAMAKAQDADVWSVSTTMTLYSLGKLGNVSQGALSTVKVAGSLFDRHILDHYRQGLNEIGAKGMYATLRESSGPYIEAVWTNFSGEKSTLTEELFTGRLLAKGWGMVRGVMSGKATGGEGE